MSTVSRSDSKATYFMAECIKKHERHDRCKQNIRHEKKYEKSKQRRSHLRSYSPDDHIEFKLKNHKADEAKTETHKSRKRYRSRSVNRASSPQCNKKPTWSHSRRSRDRLSKNSPDDNIQLKLKKHKTEEAKTETYKSKKRDRTRSINRASSPKCDKRPRWSHSHSRRDSEKIDRKKPLKINRNNFLPLVPQDVLSAGDAKKDCTAKIPTKTSYGITVPKNEKKPVIKPLSSSKSTVVLMDYQDPHDSVVEPSAFTNIPVHGINSETETEKLTGHIGTKLPSPAVLSHEYQPFVNKDQLKNTASVNSGIGVINGEDLGKYQSGSLEPVSLDVETYKRGLKKRWIQIWKNMNHQDPHDSVVEPSAFTNTHVHGINSDTEKFTGHIGTKLPSPTLYHEYQPLINKDQLKNEASANSDIGVINGEGLDKNQSGSLEPVLLDVKTGKQGLVTEEKLQGNRTEKISKKVSKKAKSILSIEGKNRVRLLYELCAKRKWNRPMFDIIDESGPVHKRTFIFAVNVNGVKYSSSRFLTKKLAKLEAANTCLEELLD